MNRIIFVKLVLVYSVFIHFLVCMNLLFCFYFEFQSSSSSSKEILNAHRLTRQFGFRRRRTVSRLLSESKNLINEIDTDQIKSLKQSTSNDDSNLNVVGFMMNLINI